MMKSPWLKNQQLALDVGSAQTKVMSDGKVIWQEPTCLSLDEKGIAINIGQAASILLGKTPPGVQVVFPVVRAACVDDVWLDQYLDLLKQKIINSKKLSINRPHYSVHLPDILSVAARQVWSTSCHRSLGLVKLVSTTQVIHNLSVSKLLPSKALIIMIGDQSTGLFVLHQQSVIQGFSWQWGMQVLLELIEKVLTENLQISVSQSTLSQILLTVASVQVSSRHDRSLVVQAKSSRHQVSLAQILTSDKFKDSIRMGLEDWLLWLQSCLSQISEESHKQLLAHGVWLIGGGANLPGLSALISEKIQCPVQVMADPELAVVKGLRPSSPP